MTSTKIDFFLLFLGGGLARSAFTQITAFSASAIRSPAVFILVLREKMVSSEGVHAYPFQIASAALFVEDCPMIKAQTFSSRIEADMAKGFLEANGIYSVVVADDQGGMRPSLAFTTGVDLKVNPEDLEKAKKIFSDQLKK